MSALTQRVLTAALLLPLVLWGIVALPTAYFALLFAFVCLLGAWEWAALAGSASTHHRVLYTLLFVFGLAGAEYLTRSRLGLYAVLAVAALWWLTALALVWRYQSGRSLERISAGWRRVAGWLILIPSWVALMFLHGQPERGVYLVMFLLALVWLADVAAFFVGRRWGRRRLASRVSPGKSWEGVAGALAAVALLATLTGW